ncbi:unnamed protein product [Rotaria sp. Silwood2]|nr:unnamed protein product [Rotaria sp. Silwood2]CAF2561626.1 unnamed protein product [Rotaria sp. Silwood2]CAF2806128.1 unnamed protein product [Rotaria sp. Silwood2]CAF3914363.1 unnamed protein product [Rotaria sp. Silwood2]CAF4002366.1 unnamed protein product [Rotaria sp. Silwood2]
MATNTTDEERNELVDELIKCGICLDYFDDPRVLPCSHTFCLKCIKQTAEHNRGQFQCPLRDDTKIDNARLDILPSNRIVRDIVEIVSSSKGKIK